MTAEARPASDRWRWATDDDAKQLIAVLVVVAIALLIGLGLRTFTEGRTRTATAGGVSASIPASWIYQPGAGDILFTAIDPRNPGQRYSVTKPSGTSGASAAQVADTIAAGKSRVLTGFQLMDRTTTTVNGNPAQVVTYAYVSSIPGQVPQVIEGRDTFIGVSSGVLIVTLESPSRTFANAIGAYDRFVASVRG